MTIQIGWKTGLFLAFLALCIAIGIAWHIKETREAEKRYAVAERLIETYEDELKLAAAAAQVAKEDQERNAKFREAAAARAQIEKEKLVRQRRKPQTINNFLEERKLARELETIREEQLFHCGAEVASCQKRVIFLERKFDVRTDQFQLRTEQFEVCKKQTKRQKRWGIARQALTHTVAALAGAGIVALAQ